MKHLHLEWVECSRRLPAPVCDALIRLGESFPLEEPTVVGEDRLKAHRVADVHLIPSVSEALPLYQLLWDTAADATKRHYGLRLSGITRMPHFVEYRAGKGHFHWHDDYSHELEDAPRKLTVVIQLSNGADYDGGDLEIFGETITSVPRERGTVICLPSFIPHRVTPVTAGIRKVIVAWIAGPRLI
jgi:PKHD-type hydroxylase